jgi:hypothetical protein
MNTGFTDELLLLIIPLQRFNPLPDVRRGLQQICYHLRSVLFRRIVHPCFLGINNNDGSSSGSSQLISSDYPSLVYSMDKFPNLRVIPISGFVIVVHMAEFFLGSD